MTNTTLALGQGSYQLLDALVTTNPGLTTGSQTTTVSSKVRGGTVVDKNLGGAAAGATVNVASRSSGLVFNDIDATTGNANNANINFLETTQNSEIGLGIGNNRFNASRDFLDSEIAAGAGNDTVRIGGTASGSLINLGAGADSLIVGKSSTDLDVNLGEGNDSALFLGALNAGTIATDRGYNNIINTGVGNDTASFMGGVNGNYELQFDAGNDSVIFGASSTSTGFKLDTGVGSDTVRLGYQTFNATIDLGRDSLGPDGGADSLILGVGSLLSDSTIRSAQTSGDRLDFAGNVANVNVSLGSGADSLVASDAVVFSGNQWNFGAGNDRIDFLASSDLTGLGYINAGVGSDTVSLLGSGFGLVVDLGFDDDTDRLFLGSDSDYAGFTINNFGSQDILIIGNEELRYSNGAWMATSGGFGPSSAANDIIGSYNWMNFRA